MAHLNYLLEDTLDVQLLLARNPARESEVALDDFVQVLLEQSGPYRPEHIGKRRFTSESFKQIVAGQDIESRRGVHVNLDRGEAPALHMTVSFLGPTAPAGTWIFMSVPMAFFADAAHAAERGDQLAAFLTALAERFDVSSGFAQSKGELSLGSDPRVEDPFAADEPGELHWLNFYGADTVAKLGRERLLSTPHMNATELSNGAVMLRAASGSPLDWIAAGARANEAQALAHIRPDLDAGRLLADRLQRAERLAPAPRDWDPDIAGLLELTLQAVDTADHAAATERLNRYRPPAVSEWRASEPRAAAGSESGPEPAVADFSDMAENLVVLVHGEVPEVMRWDPAALPRIDYHFWRIDYPASFNRGDIDGDLVPAIGAFIGEMLVRRLGGRWERAAVLDETSVVLGERAWLPFRRARHYMADRQSALDYSLTQFYRAAVRASSAD